VCVFIVSFLEERTFIMSHISRVSIILRLLKQMFKMRYSDKCMNMYLSSIIKLALREAGQASTCDF
jgi:hypothetical protein